MKILVAFSDWNHTEKRKKQNTYGGIGYYRAIKPAEQLSKVHDVDVVGQELTAFGNSLESQWDNIFKKYDVFWTSYFSDPRVAGAIFYHAQKYGKKVVLDIDDNYLDVPESNLLYERFKATKHERAYLSTSLSLADAISVSTIPLRDRLDAHMKERHGLEKKFIHVPNMNDVNDWKYEPVKLHKDRFVIGYSGSNSHKDDFAMVVSSIGEIMRKHKHVWFETLGVLAIDDLTKHLRGWDDDMLMRTALVGATDTFKEYPKWLSQRPWNVGIAPLVDTAFTRSKSHIKWMEYSMMNMPVIASKVYPYHMPILGRDTIVDGKTGLLCRNNEWFDALDDMIQNYDRYKPMAKNAYDYIKKEWQYDKLNDIVIQQLSDI